MRLLFLALLVCISWLPLPSFAAVEWAVWSGHPASTRTGTFPGGQTITLTPQSFPGVGSVAAGAGFTANPAVMGMANTSNPPYQQIMTGPEGVLIVNPDDPIMLIDLTGLPVGSQVFFGLADQKFTYQLELRDAALALLPLTGIVVTPYNITYPPLPGFPNGLVADQNSFLFGATNQIRRDALNDAVPTSNHDHTGLTVFSNLPTATRYIAMKAYTSGDNEGLDIFVGADLVSGVVVITDDAGAAGDGAVPFGNVTRNVMDVHTVTVTNNTSSPVAVSIPTLPTSPFAIADTADCTLTLAPAAACTITVSFTSGSVGDFSGSFSFDIDGTARTITLSGTGTQPNVTYIDTIGPLNNDKLLDFAATVVTGSSGTGTLTVTNSDVVNVTVSLDVTNLLASPFSFQNANACNVTLATGQSCTLTVVFAPTADGVVNDTFTLNVAGAAEVITVSGTPGLANADFQISQTASPAVVQPNGTDTTTITLTVKNNGPDSATARVTNALPSGLTFVNATPVQGSYALGAWDVGTLASGQQTTLQIVARAPASELGCLTNTATVAVADAAVAVDLITNNNNSTLLVGASACANLKFGLITQSDDVSADSYEITVLTTVQVQNLGPGRATGVKVRIVKFLADPLGDYGDVVNLPAQNTLIEVGVIDAGQSVPVSLPTARFSRGGDGFAISYELIVYGNETDPELAASQPSVLVNGEPPAGDLIAGGTTLSQAWQGSSSPCFLTTAALGSYLYPELNILRQFRDRYLLTNPVGRALVAAYYRVSPAIATVLRQQEWLRVAMRTALTPVVYAIKYPVGLAVSLLSLVAPFLARRFRRPNKSREGIRKVLITNPRSSK